MPILIRTGPDPFTEASLKGGLVLALSDVYFNLRNEIERYTRQETAGRSFLVSGHRGAGKTTVVLAAVQGAIEEFQKGDQPLRPLFVRIHGPDLFPDVSSQISGNNPAAPLPPVAISSTLGEAAAKATGNAPEEADAAKETKDVATEGSPAEVVLKQVTIALYRAAAEEFSRSYRTRVEAILYPAAFSVPKTLGPAGAFAGGYASELFELAAQLRVELDGAPSVGRLRFFWSRLQRLRSGVLFGRPTNPDQGMQELLALSSAAQAYKVVSGKWKESQTSKESESAKSSLAIQISQSIKDLLHPALGVATGGVVGFVLRGNPAVALASAVLSGLVVTVALNYSASFSDERSEDREVTFLPDRTIGSLDRMLPLLVDRFRRAGLAPVFVVDELDKIDDLEVRMGGLVRQLKHFVTERALFCFLTDRDYIEYLAQQAVKNPYPREYTYFSDRLLVFYRPEQLHAYLSQSLVHEPPADATRAATEAVDLEVLPYVLLHRSCLHAIDLQREMRHLRNESGHVALEPGAVSSTPRYQIDLFIQLAVESVLDQQQVQARLFQDPEFAQIIFDALYYASRQWSTGRTDLKIEIDPFKAYLRSRMRLQPEDPFPLSDTDTIYLHAIALQVVEYLRHPNQLVSVCQKKREIPQSVLEAVPENPILLPGLAAGALSWRHDVFGRSLQPPDVQAALARIEDYQAQIDLIVAGLQQVGGKALNLTVLSAEFRILSTSPSWEFVSGALERLTGAAKSGKTYEDIERDLYAVRNFILQAERDRQTLTLAIACGTLVGSILATNQPNSRGRLIDGLSVLSRSLSLQQATSAETRERIAKAWESWSGSSELNGEIKRVSSSWGDWKNSIQSLTGQLGSLGADAKLLDKAERSSWERWRRRVTGSATSEEINISIDDLALAARGRGPVHTLGDDLSKITIRKWTDLFLEATRPGMVPQALGNFALTKLGWTGDVKEHSPESGIDGVLLVVADSGSLCEGWIPSSRHFCVAVRRSELNQLLQTLADRVKTLGINFAFIEILGDPAELASALTTEPNEILGADLRPIVTPKPPPEPWWLRRVPIRLRFLRMVKVNLRRSAENWFRYIIPLPPYELGVDRYSYVIAPESLDDAIRKVEELRPISSGRITAR